MAQNLNLCGYRTDRTTVFFYSRPKYIVNACFCCASFARIRKHCWDWDSGECSQRKSMCICMDNVFSLAHTVNKSKRYINRDFHKGWEFWIFYWLLFVFRVVFFSVPFTLSPCVVCNPNAIIQTKNKKKEQIIAPVGLYTTQITYYLQIQSIFSIKLLTEFKQ